MPIIRRQLERIFSPVQKPVVSFKMKVDHTAPHDLPVLICDSSATVFALFPKDAPAAPIEFEGTYSNEPISASATPESFVLTRGKLIHRLAARAVLRDAEEHPEAGGTPEAIEEKFKPLALKYSLASKYTSFVAIEKRLEVTAESMKRVEVASAAPATSLDFFDSHIAPAAADISMTCSDMPTSSALYRGAE